MKKLRTDHWIVVHDLMVSFFQPGPIDDDTWQDYIDTIASKDFKKVLATSIGAVEVNSLQRKKVAEALKVSSVAVAVITDEPLVRGLMTAVAWLGNVNLKAFSWDQIGEAYRHLAPKASESQVREAVQSLRKGFAKPLPTKAR